MSCVFHRKQMERRSSEARKYTDVDEIGRKTGYRLSTGEKRKKKRKKGYIQAACVGKHRMQAGRERFAETRPRLSSSFSYRVKVASGDRSYTHRGSTFPFFHGTGAASWVVHTTYSVRTSKMRKLPLVRSTINDVSAALLTKEYSQTLLLRFFLLSITNFVDKTVFS